MESLWSRGAEEEIAFSVDPCHSLLGKSRIVFPSAGAGYCQCSNNNSESVAAPVGQGKSFPSSEFAVSGSFEGARTCIGPGWSDPIYCPVGFSPSFQSIHSPHLTIFHSPLLIFLHYLESCPLTWPHALLEQGLPSGKAARVVWWPRSPHP